MRLSEIDQVRQSTPESNLVTALELIRARYKDSDQSPKISTRSLINLVLNTDKNFDYQALVDANENNPAVKNLIKSFNKDFVQLKSANDIGTKTTVNQNGKNSRSAENTVDDMAKRAAKKRDKSLF